MPTVKPATSAVPTKVITSAAPHMGSPKAPHMTAAKASEMAPTKAHMATAATRLGIAS